MLAFTFPNQQSKAVFIVIGIFVLLTALSSIFDTDIDDTSDDTYYQATSSSSSSSSHYRTGSTNLRHQQFIVSSFSTLPRYIQKLIGSHGMEYTSIDTLSMSSSSSSSATSTSATTATMKAETEDADQQRSIEYSLFSQFPSSSRFDPKFFAKNFHRSSSSMVVDTNKSWFFTHTVPYDHTNEDENVEIKKVLRNKIFVTVVHPRVLFHHHNDSYSSHVKNSDHRTTIGSIIQQFEAIDSDSDMKSSNRRQHEWKLLKEYELSNDQNLMIHFVQRDLASPNCVIVHFETTTTGGANDDRRHGDLNVNSYVKSFCIEFDGTSQKVSTVEREWPLKDVSRTVMSLGTRLKFEKCAYMSFVNDPQAFRHICHDQNDDTSHGLASNRALLLGRDDSKAIHQVIALNEMSDRFVFTWELVSDIDSIRFSNHEDVEEEDGVDLYLRVYYASPPNTLSDNDSVGGGGVDTMISNGTKWKSSTYGRVKRVMSRVLRHSNGVSSLNTIYFYGRRMTYQSGNARTVVFCSETGELVIARMKGTNDDQMPMLHHGEDTVLSDADIRRFLSVKTFDYSKYVPKRQYSDNKSRNTVSYHRMRNTYYGNAYAQDHTSSIEKMVNELLQKQRQQLLQLNAHSVPTRVALNHDGNLIAIVLEEYNSVYVIEQVGEMWSVKQIIQQYEEARTTATMNNTSGRVDNHDDENTNDSNSGKSSSFLSRYLPSSSSSSTSQNQSTQQRRLLKVIDAQFMGQSSRLLLLFEDASFSVYQVGSGDHEASSSTRTTNNKQRAAATGEDSYDEESFHFNWQLFVLIGFIIVYFVVNEVSLRRRIRIRRQEITEERQRQRERMQQQQHNNNNQ